MHHIKMILIIDSLIFILLKSSYLTTNDHWSMCDSHLKLLGIKHKFDEHCSYDQCSHIIDLPSAIIYIVSIRYQLLFPMISHRNSLHNY
jgi:hypothetical protein